MKARQFFDRTGVTGVADQTTSADGKATGTGKAPDAVARRRTYQAHFAGDSLYHGRDTGIKIYDTRKHSVSLTLTIPTMPVTSGASYKVAGHLTDATVKRPLSSKTITFTADAPITITDKRTNTNGLYTGRETAPTGTGTYNIQSHFAGDSLYSAKDSPIRTLIVTSGP